MLPGTVKYSSCCSSWGNSQLSRSGCCGQVGWAFSLRKEKMQLSNPPQIWLWIRQSGCSTCVHMYMILVCICVVLNCTTGSQQHACQIVSAVLGVLSVSIKTWPRVPSSPTMMSLSHMTPLYNSSNTLELKLLTPVSSCGDYVVIAETIDLLNLHHSDLPLPFLF